MILDREKSVILNIEPKIDCLILRIGFLKTRIKFATKNLDMRGKNKIYFNFYPYFRVYQNLG